MDLVSDEFEKIFLRKIHIINKVKLQQINLITSNHKKDNRPIIERYEHRVL